MISIFLTKVIEQKVITHNKKRTGDSGKTIQFWVYGTLGVHRTL